MWIIRIEYRSDNLHSPLLIFVTGSRMAGVSFHFGASHTSLPVCVLGRSLGLLHEHYASCLLRENHGQQVVEV